MTDPTTRTPAPTASAVWTRNRLPDVAALPGYRSVRCISCSTVALPAMPVVLCRKANALPLRRRKKAVRSTVAGECAWYRLGHGLMWRRAVVVVGSVGQLLTLGAPVMRIKFGSINAQQLPSSSEGRQAFNAMEHDFDGDVVKSIDSLLVLKFDGTSKDQGAALKAYAERLDATEGATSARITGVEGTTARVSVTFEGNAVSPCARRGCSSPEAARSSVAPATTGTGAKPARSPSRPCSPTRRLRNSYPCGLGIRRCLTGPGVCHLPGTAGAHTVMAR
ncbi:hypothetical protein [Streptomyces sp. SA15]|uniref:hypothetical protein n=1 Tax=Streptomyces sp. SA15 TaxID=934019 RepID=UPI0015CABE86|nr:hypothetical protein [Streptomyces sp. SA15]